MQLSTICKACKMPNRVKEAFVEERVELAKRRGKVFEMQCMHCNHKQLVHVNKVYASKGPDVYVVMGLAVVAAGFAIWFLWEKGVYAAISIVIPGITYFIYNMEQQKSIQRFNGYNLHVPKEEKQRETSENHPS